MDSRRDERAEEMIYCTLRERGDAGRVMDLIFILDTWMQGSACVDKTTCDNDLKLLTGSVEVASLCWFKIELTM